MSDNMELYDDHLSTFIEAMPAVYQNNVQSVHEQALASNYPCVQQCVGSLFGSLSTVYAEHYSAKAWDINLYGDQFPDFIAAQRVDAPWPWGFVATLALLERHLLLVYYAEKDEAWELCLPYNLAGFADHLQQYYPFLLLNVSSWAEPVIIRRSGVCMELTNAA